MIRGTGPPPPLGDHPNGIDISHPSYAIDGVQWHKPPTQFPESFNNSASVNLRLKNDSAYKAVEISQLGIDTFFLAIMRTIIAFSLTRNGNE
jgi:hypothetical protein